MLAAIRRCASLVEFSLMTVNATCPGLMCFKPSLREISLQFGGKIDETRTILHAAIPALRSASSKLESRSLCLPTPLVKNIFLATNAIVPVRSLHFIELSEKFLCCGKVTRMIPSVNANRRSAQRIGGIQQKVSLSGDVADQFTERSADGE